MGGRNEVLDMSLEDALAYLIIYFERKEQEQEGKRWELFMNHLSREMAHPAQNKEQFKQQQKFKDELKPSLDSMHKAVKQEWNFEQLKQLQSEQLT